MPKTLPQRLQRLTNKLLQPLGLGLVRTGQIFNMDGLLARVAARGFEPATVIDIGASDGVWSLAARRHFPASKFLLFEALIEQQPVLEHLHQKHGFEIVHAAAGAAPGVIRFSIDPNLDGSGVASPDDPHAREVPVETIDATISRRGLPGPYLLKLDTHGYELAVLAGATKTLAETRLIIVESYNFQLTSETLRFHELCAWMETHGFRCCDLADPMRRPGDGVLWQVDLAFAPANSPFFARTSYR